MQNFKVFLLFKNREGPGGGGNAFLRGLEKYLSRRDRLAGTPGEADVILFNGHHQPWRVLMARLRYPSALFVHRVDGLVAGHRGRRGRAVDSLVFALNREVSDATVFQSEWSRSAMLGGGLAEPLRSAIIHNAADEEIFYPPGPTWPKSPGSRLRLITTSWSANPRKGLDVYRWLDENMDKTKYELTYVGNPPAEFENIRQLPPMPPADLADELRRHDVYLAPSLDDACSNALIEGLACGLPALARRSGGHPELTGRAGLLFDGPENLGPALETMASTHRELASFIQVETLSAVTGRYLDFFDRLLELDRLRGIIKKRPGTGKVLGLVLGIFRQKLSGYLRTRFRRPVRGGGSG